MIPTHRVPVEIIAADGRIVHRENGNSDRISIDLEQLPSAIYVARVLTVNGIEEHRFVKQWDRDLAIIRSGQILLGTRPIGIACTFDRANISNDLQDLRIIKNAVANIEHLKV